MNRDKLRLVKRGLNKKNYSCFCGYALRKKKFNFGAVWCRPLYPFYI